MDILESDIADDLIPLRLGGITLYPAEGLGRISDWAGECGRSIEWIEGAFYDSTTDIGQHSLAYICIRQGGDYSAFRETCLRLAGEMQAEASRRGMPAFFEVGISN